jgi:hypothetical protein
MAELRDCDISFSGDAWAMPDWSDALLEYLAARGRGPGIGQNRPSSSPQAGRVTGPAELAIRLLSQIWVRPERLR